MKEVYEILKNEREGIYFKLVFLKQTFSFRFYVDFSLTIEENMNNTNINCIDCDNCLFCNNCSNCNKCVNCNNCNKCNKCVNCNNCNKCVELFKSNFKENVGISFADIMCRSFARVADKQTKMFNDYYCYCYCNKNISN